MEEYIAYTNWQASQQQITASEEAQKAAEATIPTLTKDLANKKFYLRIAISRKLYSPAYTAYIAAKTAYDTAVKTVADEKTKIT